VAIKLIHGIFSADPAVAERFRNEARSYAQINHPNAIQLHDFGQDEQGRLYISMELVEGCDLKRTLAREGRLPPQEAMGVALQIADVLGAAHARGIVHRDLKPENVMLTRGLAGLHVTVLDFGLAHLADSATHLTAPGMVCGTPRYMAPEQSEGEAIDLRVDVYALGLLLFESLTGRHPFECDTISEMLRKQRTAPVPLLAEMAPDLAGLERLDAVIQRATAKNRDQRFGSMLELARALSGNPELVSSSEAGLEETLVRAPSPMPAAPVSSSGLSATHTPVGAAVPTPRPQAAGPALPLALATPAATPSGPSAPALEKKSRLPLIAAATALLVVGAGATLFAVHRSSVERADLRARLDSLYRANREPPPPPACQEKTAAGLATLFEAAPRLADAIPEASRAQEGSIALAGLETLSAPSPEAALMLAKARVQVGQPAGSALAIATGCPRFAAAESFAANVALKEKRLDEADQRYLAALEAAPDFTKARLNRAVLKFQQGKADESIALLQEVVGKEPDNAEAHLAMAIVRERKAEAARTVGEPELADKEAAAARASYCRALELGNKKAASGCVR
jgi:tetratricopeptide (TPR) repeat protein